MRSVEEEDLKKGGGEGAENEWRAGKTVNGFLSALT